MSDRTETIGIRLTPAEREKFESFVEESNEFDSLSRFLRVIAHQRINENEEKSSVDPEEITEAVDAAVSPVSQRLEEIEQHILSIDANTSDDDKIDKLARDIYATLPVHDSGSEMVNIEDVLRKPNISELAMAQQISTPYIWSEFFDASIADTRRACARVLEYYPDAEFISEDLQGSGADAVQHDDMDLDSNTGGSNHTDNSPKSGNQDGVDRTVTPGSSENLQPDDVVDGSTATVHRYYKTTED